MKALLANWLESPLFVPILIVCVIFGSLMLARQFIGKDSNGSDSDGYK